MIEFFLLSRFLVDFLYEFKALSVLHVCAFFFPVMLGRLRQGNIKFFVIRLDFLIPLFGFCVIFSFLFNVNEDTFTILMKFVVFYMAYLIGCFVNINSINVRVFGFSCILAIFAFGVAAAIGVGYQTWGGALTFSGGYFFKTDMALSAALLLAGAVSFPSHRYVLFGVWIVTFWIILITNARIFLPIVICAPFVVAYVLKTRSTVKINLSLMVYILFGGVLVFYGLDYVSSLFANDESYLTISFDDFFSAENTQGRSVIWEAELAGFYESGFLSKLFGGGLDVDRYYTSIFSDVTGLEDANSHNVFLYVLVSLGVVGVFVMSGIIFDSLHMFSSLLPRVGKGERWILYFSALLIITFFVAGFSTDLIVRPQFMVLMSFFIGLMRQKYVSEFMAFKR